MNGIGTVYMEKDRSGGWLFGRQTNRAALFGDGLFETMVFVNGKIRFGKRHSARLTRGLELLEIDSAKVSRIADLERSLEDMIGGEGIWRVRWNIFRGGMGKYTPTTNEARESVLVQPFRPAPVYKKNAGISQRVRLYPDPWANVKTLNALPYVMANLERMQRELEEILLTDADGYLSEAGAANLFWTKSSVYYTPALKHNCIAGVGRAELMAHLKKSKVTVVEGSFRPEDILEADQVFTTNVTGVSYLESFEQKTYSTESLAAVEQVFALI